MPSRSAVRARTPARALVIAGSRPLKSSAPACRLTCVSSTRASTRLPGKAGSKSQSGSSKGSSPVSASMRVTRRGSGFCTARLMSAPANRSLPEPA